MKKRARDTEETPQQIISQSVALLSEQAAVAMPPIHHIRRDISCQKKRTGNPLPVPQDKDFDILPEYHQTTSGQQFLLLDSGHGEDLIIIFTTDENIQLFGTCTIKRLEIFLLYATQNCSFKNHQPTMRLCQPCTTLYPCLMYFTAKKPN